MLGASMRLHMGVYGPADQTFLLFGKLFSRSSEMASPEIFSTVGNRCTMIRLCSIQGVNCSKFNARHAFAMKHTGYV